MSRATVNQLGRVRPGRATSRRVLAAGPGAGLAAAGLALLTVGALGPFSDVGATLETSLAVLILVVGLDQSAFLGTTLLVGKLPARPLARLVWVTASIYGLVLGVDWALEQRFDALSLGVVALSLAVAAPAVRAASGPA